MIKRRVWVGLGLLAVALIGLYGCAKVATPAGPITQNYGTLTGVVSNTSGVGVSGVTVTAAGTFAATNQDGWFAIPGIAAANLTVSFSKTDYVGTSRTASITAGRSTHVTVSLLQMATAQSLTVASGGTRTFGTSRVTFPANAFENADGTAFTGTTANISVTPGSFGTTDEVNAFPGNFQGVDATGATVPFESFGWADVYATGSGPLKVKDNVTWNLEITNTYSGTPSATSIPVWYFKDGAWKAAKDAAGNQINAAYNAGTNKFTANILGGDLSGTPWNIDLPWQSQAYIKGRVIDSNGNPVSSASITTRSQNMNWLAGATTGSDGRFGPMAVAGSANFVVWASKGAKTSASKSVSALSSTTYTQTNPYDVGDILLESPLLQFTLTWGLDPRDLDSHLTIPKELSTSTYRYHLYYGNRSTTPSTSYPYANLDTDDTTSYGPEHTTVYKLYNGTYRFSVHHFAGSSTIQDSGARVDLNVDDGYGSAATYTFYPPSGQPTDKVVWQVCDIAVSDGRITSVDTLGTYGTESKDTYDPGGEADQIYTTSAAQIQMVK